MKFCTNCGKQIEDDACFCYNCGLRIENTTLYDNENNVQLCEATDEVLVDNESNNLNQSTADESCKKCGTLIKNDACFCHRCGVPLDKPVEEKTYSFKEMNGGKELKDILKGKEIYFKVTEHMLVVIQQLSHQSKLTVIPYNEIKSFEIKKSFNWWIIVLVLLISLSALFIYKIVGMEAIYKIIVLLALCLYMLIFLLVSTDVTLRMVYDKNVKFSLRRLSKKGIINKQLFEDDLNQRLNQTEKLSEITKEETNIHVGIKADSISTILKDEILDKI